MNLKVPTAAAALILATTSLAAEELCVVCTGPPATYRCDAATNPATGASFQLLCVKQIATRGGHDSCSVDRTRTNVPCDGVLVTLEQPADGAVLPPPPAARATALPIATPPSTPPGAAPNPAQSDNAPPATMEELAKETAEQSKKDWAAANDKVQESAQAAGQSLKKAGGAVGDAVKKSWNCVVSLFSQC